MKKALLVGCGSKWGGIFTKHLSDVGYQIDLISNSDFDYPNVNLIKIDWFNLDVQSIKNLIDNNVKYDLIFFNQNSGGGINEEFFKPGNDYNIEHWNYHSWINCQLPYFIVKHLSKSISNETKIGWMMTGLIVGNESKLYRYAGYASVKSSNLHFMRAFSQFHPGIFFAINPGWFPEEKYLEDANSISKVIDNLKEKDSGKSFNKDGSFWI
jgi:hypothetical protein